MWKWWESNRTGWTDFYLFLEESANTAKKQLTAKSIISALSGGEGDKSKCPTCRKYHTGQCNKVTAAVSNRETCPACEEASHKYKTKTGKEATSKRVKDCPGFKAADEEEKEEMVKKIKTNHPVCTKCSSWSHSTEDCTWKLACEKCGEIHLNDLCNLKKFFTCTLSRNQGSSLMCLQDVNMRDSSVNARTLFDNGSELTLISSIFAKKNNLPYEEATYTISGVGGATTYNAGTNGRVYTVPLVESNGETVYVKAFSVNNILSSKVGRSRINLNPGDFPRLNKEDLQEAVKPLPKRYLDLLVGNEHLGLQPACGNGFGCQDCAKGRCIYKSLFGCGLVPIGSFHLLTKDKIQPVNIAKMSPPLKKEEYNVEHATINNHKEEANKLLQDVTVEPGKEALPENNSTFHSLLVKARGISAKSGLIAFKSVPPGLLSCSRLKQRAVSSLHSGGFGYIHCPPQLHEQRVNYMESTNLQDAVLITNPVITDSGAVKQAKASQEIQTTPQADNKLNRGRYGFYNYDVAEIPVFTNSTRIVPGTKTCNHCCNNFTSKKFATVDIRSLSLIPNLT